MLDSPAVVTAVPAAEEPVLAILLTLMIALL